MKYKNNTNRGISYKGHYVGPFEEIEITESVVDIDYDRKLMSIKGIGKKTISEIKAFAQTEAELVSKSNEEIVSHLRDDVAEKIIKIFKERE